jgi:glutamate-1-semialdehyde aminotransferase
MSTTNGAETPGLAAMKQVLKIYETDRVCDYLWNFGARLTKLIREVSASHNFEGALLLQGASIAPKIELRWGGINNSLLLRTLFMDELAQRNVIFPIMSGIAWSQSHKDKELRFLSRALDQALDSMKKTLKSNTAKSLAQQLRHQVQPVFRRHN